MLFIVLCDLQKMKHVALTLCLLPPSYTVTLETSIILIFGHFDNSVIHSNSNKDGLISLIWCLADFQLLLL